MKLRTSLSSFLLAGALLGAGSLSGQDIPRTADGKPDLQGNWSNATMTPVQRPAGRDLVLTPEQVAQMEGGRQALKEAEAADSDPDREAPPVGGDGSTGAAGGTGGYNYFYIDAGDQVAVYNGEPRSSLVTFPENGRIPSLTAKARAAFGAERAATAGMGEYDNPEQRPLAERCVLSFGSNAGPPMLPNYFYNNNYTIVQTPDHVMIMTEMVHDVRVIPILDAAPDAAGLAPWFGTSWGRWDGDTLVIETTGIRHEQRRSALYVFPGGSENMRVIERLTRADENTINYEFTVEDLDHYEGVWGGEVPFTKLDARLYEYACHEANYALFNILSGARAQEREAAGGSN